MGNRQEGTVHHLIHISTAVAHTYTQCLEANFRLSTKPWQPAQGKEVLQARLLYSNGLFVDHIRDV